MMANHWRYCLLLLLDVSIWMGMIYLILLLGD